MESVTLIFALLASGLVFALTPIYGLVVYIAAMACYPSYLAVSVGTVDFTVQRIVILAIFAKMFLQTGLPGRFKIIWLDKLVLLYFLCQIVAGSITTRSLMMFLENRAGAIFDMVLPYFAVRMIVSTKEQYIILLKGVLAIAAPLALVGFYQCITGDNPVGFFRKYDAWKLGEVYLPTPRHGFFRADVTFPMSIMYGLFFAMFGPVCAGILRNVGKNKILCRVGLGLMVLGVFSSMSSGPMLAILSGAIFILFYRWRKHWKPIMIGIVAICGVVEIVSNRHFYDVLGSFTLNPTTAWYRSKLIDVALFEGGMSNHWIVGFGNEVEPGWSEKIDGRGHTDMVNHYLLILSRYGLMGLAPFLALNLFLIKGLRQAYKISVADSDRYMVWCLAASMFGLSMSFFSVSLFGQPATIYYLLMGFCGVMPMLVTRAKPQMCIVSGAHV